MSNYSESDFCQADQGIDYIFGRMGAIYGAAFMRHWDGVDHGLVRQTWLELLGVHATYKPKIDYALNHMDAKFPPSALAFKQLCNDGPRIPSKPNTLITKQPTQEEIRNAAKAKEEALAKLREFTSSFKQKSVSIIGK
jgi:hypothetical protein